MKLQRVIVLLGAQIMAASMGHAAVPAKTSFPEGEKLVYARVVEAFRKNNLAELLRNRALLEKNYATSVHLDNAYYLTGVLEVQNNRLGEGIKSFETVRRKFPNSNKRPSALFALGSTYQKLNLQPLAVKVWRSILQEYPGSPEAHRAQMQLQIAKRQMAKK